MSRQHRWILHLLAFETLWLQRRHLSPPRTGTSEHTLPRKTYRMAMARMTANSPCNICAMCFIQAILLSVLLLVADSVDDVCPSQCRCLDKASVVTCTKASYTHIPRFPSTTMMADLDHNNISILHNYTFDTAPRIEIISLEDNGIIHIEGGAFLALPDLEILRLGENQISFLPKGIFQANRKLQVLDLHSNAFTEIPDYVLYPLRNLQTLNVSFNSLTTPMLGPGFKVTTKLRTIDLSGNHLRALQSHVFQASLWWDEKVKHHLNLSNCNISQIFPNSVNQLYHIDSLSLKGNIIPPAQLKLALEDISISSLEMLNLSKMNITDIHEFFHRSQHRKLVRLWLSHNRIQRIKNRTFYYLSKLQLLDLSHNDLENVGDLDGLSSLEYLYLSGNKLKTISNAAFDGLSLLQTLDLSHNQLTNIDEIPFQTLFDLHTLDLGSNHLTSFSITTGFENLGKLSLRDNKLTSMFSASILMKLRNLDVSGNDISFIGPDTFRGQTLKTVDLSRNKITSIDGNAFGDSVVEILDISHNKLTALHYYGLNEVREYHVQANDIKNISVDAFYRLNTLSELNLEHNQIVWFPRYLFTPAYTLKTLSLSDNPRLEWTAETTAAFSALHKLQTFNLAHVGLRFSALPTVWSNLTMLRSLDISRNDLSAIAFENTSRLTFLNVSHNLLAMARPDFMALENLHHLQKIDLSNNPFQCTCELMPFRNWLTDTNVSVVQLQKSRSGRGTHVEVSRTDPTAYNCAGPAEWKSISILDFHLESTTCYHHEKAFIFASIICGIIILLILLLIFVYKYKRCSTKKVGRTQYSAISPADTATHVQLHLQSEHEVRNGKEWL